MTATRSLRRLVGAIASLTLVGACTGSVDPELSGVGPPTTSPPCRSRPSEPVTHQYAERQGADPDRTSLDIYMPVGCESVPVVMWVHGGGWQRGDKRSGFVERKAAWAASIGAALVAVNYRLSAPNSSVMWPDHGEDVAAAVAWVQREGASHGLVADRMVLLGHSAGAHLVSIVSTHPALLKGAGADPARIACIIPLDFSFDLATAPARALIVNAFGSDPAVLEDASPSVQIDRNGAPRARFLVGTRGGLFRVAEAQRFVDLVNDRGGDAQLLDANPYTHNQISSQLGAPAEGIVTPFIGAFASSCFA